MPAADQGRLYREGVLKQQLTDFTEALRRHHACSLSARKPCTNHACNQHQAAIGHHRAIQTRPCGAQAAGREPAEKQGPPHPFGFPAGGISALQA